MCAAVECVMALGGPQSAVAAWLKDRKSEVNFVFAWELGL
jgi:hypothetical protein